MLILAATTDKLDMVVATAADIDTHVSYVDVNSTTGAFTGSGKQNASRTTAATHELIAVPGASTIRNIKTINIRNKDTVDATDITVRFDQSGTFFELFKTNLKAGEVLNYVEGIGWFVYKSARTDRWMKVSGADYVNATTSFTDITGLTCPVESGKIYNFEAHLIHFANASTTGPRFGINGPTLTTIRLAMFDQVTITSVDAAVIRAGTTTTAVDTSIAGLTLTGKTTDSYAIITGQFTAGANGTFAMRGQSEVAVAAGLTVRQGSWLHVWEPTG